MTAFVVMNGIDEQSADRTEFVRDRFSVIAFIVPVIWLLWHRLWIEAFAALAAAVGLAALGTVAGFQGAAPILSLLVSVYVALEGPQLRIWSLRRRGYHEAAIVEADSQAEAEIRYFHRERTTMPKAKLVATAPGTSAAAATPANPALGLFDYPGSR